MATIDTYVRLLEDELCRLQKDGDELQFAAYMRVLSRTFHDLLEGIQTRLPRGLETPPCWLTRQLVKEFAAESDRIYKRLPEMFSSWLPIMIFAVHFTLEDFAAVHDSPYTEGLRRRVRRLITALKTGGFDSAQIAA